MSRYRRPSPGSTSRIDGPLPAIARGDPVSGARYLAGLLSAAIEKAERLGLSDVVAQLDAALKAAERHASGETERTED